MYFNYKTESETRYSGEREREKKRETDRKINNEYVKDIKLTGFKTK